MPIRISFGAALAVSAALAAVIAFGILLVPANAQMTNDMRATAFRFKVQLENYPPPNEAQIKTLLEGAKAEPQGSGLILMTEAWLKTFSTNGILEFQVHSPRCLLDVVQRTVNSTGLLEIIQTGENGFSVQAQGFLLQTNSTLLLSNRVQTVIRSTRGKSPLL